MAQGKRGAAQAINATEKKREALRLRKQGLSLRAIGEKLKLSHEAVRGYIQSALAEVAEETLQDATQLRALEVERLDAYLLALAPKIEKGDTQAISTALRVTEQRAKLLGIYAAEKQEVSGPAGQPQEQRIAIDLHSMSDDELRRFIQHLKN